MSLQLQRRFYKSVELRPFSSGSSSSYELLLDDRPVYTPKKRKLCIGQKHIASLVAEEWRLQGTYINPSIMPLTKLLNSAIDVVHDNRSIVIDDILKYAASDLLCYRAQSPDTLVAAQLEIWEPILKSIEEDLGYRFERTNGVIFIEQPNTTLNEIRNLISSLPDTILAALHLITNVTGSALLALLLYKKKISVEKAWAAAQLDEDWQNSYWGIDPEAKLRRLALEKDYKAASILLEYNL